MIQRLRLIAAASAAACALTLVAGCSNDNDGKDTAGDRPSSSASTASPSSSESSAASVAKDLLPPVSAYVNGVKNKDLDGLAGAFAENAELIDSGRRFNGRAAIRDWAKAEVIGGTLTVIKVAGNRPGYQRLLVRFAPGGTGGFEAYYAFTVTGSAITKAELTYA
ncbi:nuclear transport factor 2 family protein [Actinomadura sp. 6N118]|uniref:nuclear transport factor 2 family protein n=1 Tax=Actinomadura sp. 6N118 TaxID=3375151 RepID=UPI0037ADECE1